MKTATKTKTANKVLGEVSYTLRPVDANINNIAPFLFREDRQFMRNGIGKYIAVDIVDYSIAVVDEQLKRVYYNEIFFMEVDSDDADLALLEANYKLNGANFINKYIVLKDDRGNLILFRIVNADFNYTEFCDK